MGNTQRSMARGQSTGQQYSATTPYSYPVHPSTTPSSHPHIYVLPYPPPPYQYASDKQYTFPGQQNYQYSAQRDPAAESYPTEPGQPLEQSSTQGNQPTNLEEFGQSYQRNSVQTDQPTHLEESGQSYLRNSVQTDQPTHRAQPGQLIEQRTSESRQPSRESPAQPGQPYQQYYRQPGQPYQQYPGQPRQQPYYGPHPTAPPAQNVQYIAVHPPSAHGSPMVRRGPWREGTQEEAAPEGWTGFEDKKIRAVFVRKVYIILMIQLLFTMAVIALFIFEPHVKHFVLTNRYMYYISLAIFIAVYLGLVCSNTVRRKFPMNVIVLFVFTLAMSYMLGTISAVHHTESVFMAMGICAAVCVAVSIFSFYTKFDFTSCGGILCILLLVLILFGVIAIFFPSRVMAMIYAATGAIVFTLFLAYNTQMMMGGKNYELSPEEYVFAAVQLYIDIVYIFLFILMMFGANE